jgi:hypothetical protein
MLIAKDEISDLDMLQSLLRIYDIALPEMPPLPIKLQDLVYFMQAHHVDAEAVDRFVGQVNDSANLFGPLDRELPLAHWWPGAPDGDSRTLSAELFWSKRRPVVSKGTSRIVSLGSCFAIEVAKHLQMNGYNYLVKEPNPIEGTTLHKSSARWGTIFNVFGFLQVVSWAFGFEPPPLVCYDVGRAIRDPFREDVEYTPEEAADLERIWREHLTCSRAALAEADIVILTVGLNEVFRYLPTGHYLHRTPWGLNPALWTKAILTVEQNYQTLKTGIERLRQHNPDVKIIISVSPVPLARTFRRDVHVAAATMHSKAVLRIAVEALCADLPGVHYMASFETVMYPGDAITAWVPDQRHVSTEVVAKVMRLFEEQFCGA